MSTIRGGFVSGTIALAVEVRGTEQALGELRRLSQEGKTLTVTLRNTGQVADETAAYYRKFGSAISSVTGWITQMSITTFVFLLTLRQMHSTQRQVATAQEQAAEAIRRYGRNSTQARQALRRLAQAQENARLAQFGFFIQVIATIGSITTLILQLPVLKMQLQATAAAYSELALAAGSARAAMGDPTAWTAIALGIGTAITIGGIYLAGGLGGGEAEFDRQWSETGRYVKQRAFRESRRYG